MLLSFHYYLQIYLHFYFYAQHYLYFHCSILYPPLCLCFGQVEVEGELGVMDVCFILLEIALLPDNSLKTGKGNI